MSGSKKPKRDQRVDDELVRRGLADSKKTAQALIMAGEVIVEDQRVDKPSTLIATDTAVRLKDDGRFVSRGGDKLYAAIEDLNLLNAFKGMTILDVGSSTGGFTDCCLQLGAERVIAVDVGTNQLAWKLRTDPRVISLEQTDIRNFTPPSDFAFDWVVADISFNSLARMIDAIVKIAPHARLLLLIKPQFELPRDRIPDGGVVTDENDRQEAMQMAVTALEHLGKTVSKQIDARVAGRSGNRELFILV